MHPPPRRLIEAELFGVENGLHGATVLAKAVLERAHGGTDCSPR